jgi:hypothetical protein
VDNGFCHRDGDAVCGEGEHPGVAGADGFAVDCGCGPGTFYMLKPGSGASCGDGEEWRVFYGSTASVAAGEEGLRRQPGEIWSQPDYVEGQSGAGYWDNGLNSARYRMPYLYPCSAGETESEHCFRIFRRWLWVDDGAENALLWVNVSNMEGLRINGCRRRILGIE